MNNMEKALIGTAIGILGLLVFIGLVYVALTSITPTDVKIITVLEKNERVLLSIDGVVGAGIARDERNRIIGIAVYIEERADTQRIPKRLDGFDVFVKKINEASEFERERMIIRK